MISCYADYLWRVVRVRPLVSVPVSGDRHSVSYSPLDTAEGTDQPRNVKPQSDLAKQSQAVAGPCSSSLIAPGS